MAIDVLHRKVAFNEITGTLFVVFYTNDSNLGEIGPIAVDVPIQNGTVLSGAALDAWIHGFRPQQEFDRRDFIRSQPQVAAAGFAPLKAGITPLPPPGPAKPVDPDLTAKQNSFVNGAVGREAALEAVDGYAELCRRQVITAGSGMVYVYGIKEKAARAILAAEISTHPLVKADVDAGIALNLTVAAQRIISNADAVLDYLGNIERVRMKTKQSLKIALPNADFKAIVKAALIEFESFSVVAHIPVDNVP